MPSCTFCDHVNPAGARSCASCGAELPGGLERDSPGVVDDTQQTGDDQILDLLARGQKIEAIKLYRERTGLGLKEAKDAVESMERGEIPVQPAANSSGVPNGVLEALRRGNKIEAIKLYRESAGVGLKEAKDAVEAIARVQGIVTKSGCAGVLAVLFAIVGFICGVTMLLTPALGADEAAAKELLKDNGLRVTSTGLLLEKESAFNKTVAEIAGLKRKLSVALKSLKVVETQEENGKEEIARLMQANVGLNTQLANLRNGDVTLNNRLVGALNANIGQVQLLQSLQEKHKKQLDEVRKEANTARAAYVGRVLELRPLAEKVTVRYKELSGDAKLRSAVEELSASSGKTYAFEPSRSFQSNLKKIETIEKSIVSEKVALRRQGNSYYASVVIDGEHAHEMIVDTGASLLSLPYRMAKECGIEVTDADQSIVLTIADGTRISGKLKKIDSIRVGQFTVNDVECAILGPEAVEAMPLLGMSFLGKFKFELNAQSSELSLIRIDGEEPPRGPRKSASKKKEPATKKNAAGEKPPVPGGE